MQAKEQQLQVQLRLAQETAPMAWDITAKMENSIFSGIIQAVGLQFLFHMTRQQMRMQIWLLLEDQMSL